MRTRETIAAPRADWMLLRMHYLRIVGPLATVTFGTLLTLMAVMYGLLQVRPATIDAASYLDRIAIVLAAFLALPVGAAVFSRPFKEQHVLLFHALPIPRLRQWMLFATSSLLALLTVWAGLALLRPGAAAMVVRSRALMPFGLLTAISFAAGLCFSMLFVRAFAVYVSAYIATLLVPLIISAALYAPQIAYSRLPPAVSLAGMLSELVDRPRILWPGLVLLTGLVIAAGLLAASAAFYVRGEMTLPRVQVRNALVILGGVALVSLLGAPLTHALWPGPRVSGEVAISPDGRNVVVRHGKERAPWHSDLTVHDLVSGRSVTFDVAGYDGERWTSRGEILVAIRDIAPLRRLMYLRAPHDRIQRWSAAGVKLGEEVYDGEILTFSSGVVVVRDGAVARAFALQDGRRGRELLQAPVPYGILLHTDFVIFDYLLDREVRVWRLANGAAREIPRAPIASVDQRPHIFEGMLYPSGQGVVRKIEESWPAPREAGARAGYVFWLDARWVFAVVAQPSTLIAKLYVLDVASKRWKLVSDAIPLQPNELPAAEVGFYDRTTATAVQIESNPGIALFVERVDGRLRHRIYDATRDVAATLFERAAGDRRRFTMRSHPLPTPPAARMVSIHANLQPVAEFLWRDGRVEPLAIRGGGEVRAIWPDGTQVRHHGPEITLIDPRGGVRRVDVGGEK